jgi:serine protease Do
MKGFLKRTTGYWAVSLLALSIWTAPAQARSLPDFTDLVAEASPAVVNISTTQKVKSPAMGLPPGMEIPEGPWGDLFRHFFGDGEGGIEEYDAKSLGSGFIISQDGYILTNHHVVKDADEIIVRLSDRRELKAEVIGSDERSDVALVKVEAEGDLPVVEIGKSREVKVGEWVLAIGTPFGFDHSVTAGIVSALGRSLPNESYVPFIQTDVAINPGNSGGPLFNMDGEVVGVNSQIYSRTGGYMGLSFAIPIDVAMDVADQLKTKGRVTRGWLGVLIQGVTRELAESFDMDHPHGALVAQVLADSPAEAAGIQVGDIIVEFNGTEVPDSASLPPIVGRTKVDKAVPVKVIRNGKPKTLSVTIGELPEEEKLKEAAAGRKAGEVDRLGVQVADLTKEQRAEMEIEEDGVLVKQVGDGPAAKAGIRSGDVIMMIDNVRVKDADQFETVVSELPADKSVAVLVNRQGSPLFLALRVPEGD